MVWIDGIELRASELWQMIETLTGDEAFDQLKSATGITAFNDFQEVVFGYADPGHHQDGEFLAVVKGTFNTKTLLSTVLKDKKTKAIEIGAFSAAEHPDYHFVALTDRTFLWGTRTIVAKSVQLSQGGKKSFRGENEFENFALNDGMIARLRYRRGLKTPDFSELGKLPPAIDKDAILGIDLTVAQQSALELQLDIATQSEIDAAGLNRNINDTKKELGKNFLIVFLGIDWIFDKVKTVHNAKVVSVSLSLDSRDIEELQRLAERFRKLRELTDGEESILNKPLSMPVPEERSE